MGAMKDASLSEIRDTRGMARPEVCRWRFDARAAIGALVAFVLLVLLATVGARTGWLRGFFGDVLAVIWLYACFRTVIGAPPWSLALAAVGVGCALELSQYIARLWHLRIGHPVLRVLLGSTPDWMDVLAYALGGVAVLASEAVAARRRC
jgi:hypothetical protein